MTKPPVCAECKHYEYDEIGTRIRLQHLCRRPNLISLVTGLRITDEIPLECKDERSRHVTPVELWWPKEACGPHGIYFEPRDE